MLDEIIARLQDGSISNVVGLGDGNGLPSPPYVCVVTEIYPVGRGIRVIVHDIQGNRKTIELYIFNELPDLLSNFSFTDEYGNYVTVKDAQEWTDIIPGNDDSTLFAQPGQLCC